MADFCKQYVLDLFGEDFEDMAGLCDQGEFTAVVCEGCGKTFVDHTGQCVGQCLNKHGTEMLDTEDMQ